MVVRPRATLDWLAGQTSIRPAVLVTLLGVLLGWLNIGLFALAGYDWLGTRRELPDPTFVGFFGQMQVNAEGWVPIFTALLPVMAVCGLAVVPGLTHLASKVWRGQGSFEQMVNSMAFALAVPSLIIRSASEILFGVPANLISGHAYWWSAAMNSEMGPAAAAIWNFFVIGIYITGFDVWIITLGTLAIRRIERIPTLAAAGVMLVTYLIWTYGIEATFIR
jgi:hypothetical protein